MGSKGWRGYPLTTMWGCKPILVTRLVLAAKLGRDLLPDMVACHACDNPPCCNPDHLWEGTLRDNSEDMWTKGMGASFEGEKHPYSKLTESQAIEIQALVDAGVPKRKIAKMFGIGKTQVGRISRGESWSHILKKRPRKDGGCGDNPALHRGVKLIESDVVKIRELLKTNNNSAEIARLFKVSRATIRAIRKRQTWRHLP